MKKKLGIIAALAMCVTVGGVYAQWSYSQAPAEGMHGTKAVEIAGVSTSTKTGIITVDTTGFSIEIDDTDKDYYGELMLTGTITVTFTPNPGVDTTVTNSGIPMQVVFSSPTLAALQYDFSTMTAGSGTQVFSIDETPLILNGGARTKEWTITAADVAQRFKLNGYVDGGADSCVHLPTYEAYTKFKTALGQNDLTITVSEYVAPANP